MANTSIKIKRSTTTSSPASLAAGELAYSYLSNTIFIGSPAGTGVVNIGGQYYTSQIEAATDSATGGTLVRRDANGNAAFGTITATTINATIEGNANSATQFQTDRYINISGGDVVATAQLYNGTANATLSASLSTVSGLSAGTYGGTTTVPIVTVAANGRVMAIANSATIATSLNIQGDSGTDTINLATDTLDFEGGSGVITAVTDNKVSYAVDNATVLRTNTAIQHQTIDGNVEISGNLIVLGTETVINVETLNIADPLIFLAANNNISDAVDIGFSGNYSDGTIRHAGVFRHAGTKEFYVFDNYSGSHANNVIDVGDSSFRVANLHANLISQYANVETLQATTLVVNSLSLTTDLTVPNGGTGALTTLANTTYTATGSGAANNTISSLSVDAYGRTTAATFEAISGLTVAQGGTGVNTFGAGQIVVGDGTNGLKQLANVTYTQTGTLTTANTVSAITVDAYGRVSALTSSAIGIDANQITGGTLTVGRGGTGASSFTSGALLVGNGSGAISELANSTYTATGSAGAAKTVTSLTVDAYGRVTAATFADISGLTVSQGGTGASTFTTNGIVYGNGTGAMQVTAAAGTSDQTWSNQILTVTNAGVPVWSSALDGGQF
jgi:hypothetical protein